MICENDILKCFENLGGSKRVRLLHQLLHMCHPLELRFIANCVEAACQSNCADFNKHYIAANNPASLKILSSPTDSAMRTTLLVYICLLRSNNKLCSVILYDKLIGSGALCDYCNYLIHELSSGGSLKSEHEHAVEEFVLILTMAVLHPAFDFSDRHRLLELYRKFYKIYTFSRFKSLHCNPKRSDSIFERKSVLRPNTETSQLVNGTSALHNICSCFSREAHICGLAVVSMCSDSSNSDALLLKVMWSTHRECSHLHVTISQLQSLHDKLVEESVLLSTPLLCCPDRAVIVSQPCVYVEFLSALVATSGSPLVNVVYTFFREMADERSAVVPPPTTSSANTASNSSGYCSPASLLSSTSTDSTSTPGYTGYSRCGVTCVGDTDVSESHGVDANCQADCRPECTNGFGIENHNANQINKKSNSITPPSASNTPPSNITGEISSVINPNRVQSPDLRSSQMVESVSDCVSVKLGSVRFSSDCDLSLVTCNGHNLGHLTEYVPPTPMNYPCNYIRASTATLLPSSDNYANYSASSSSAVVLSPGITPGIPVNDSRTTPPLSVVCPPHVGYLSYPLYIVPCYTGNIPIVVSNHSPTFSSDLDPSMPGGYCPLPPRLFLTGETPRTISAPALAPVRPQTAPVTFYQQVPPPVVDVGGCCCYCGHGGHGWRRCGARESRECGLGPASHAYFKLDLDGNSSALDR